MSNAPVGIIDSGLGGLTVFREIQAILPCESIRYLGDTANIPYGAKRPSEIYHLSHALIQNMVDAGAKTVVIACNTISVNCIQELRADFPELPIVGMEPAIKPAAVLSKTRRIGVLSTVATANSHFQQRKIAEYAADCYVINRGTNELVPRIESGRFDEIPGVLREVLQPFQEADVDALVLGCSHYPILKNEIHDVLGDGVTLLDSGAAIARQLFRVLVRNGIEAPTNSPAEYEFITSAPSPTMPMMLERLGIRTAVAV